MCFGILGLFRFSISFFSITFFSINFFGLYEVTVSVHLFSFNAQWLLYGPSGSE